MAKRQRSSRSGTRLGVELLEPRLTLSGTGLTAQYFHNADFTGLADTRTEAVNFNLGTAGPGAGIDADSFSVRWTGQVLAEFSQTYTFRVLADEGVRVWVDGQLLINDWTPHVRRFASGTIALTAGQKYDIRVDYYEASGPAQIELSWFSPSQSLEVIPLENLFASPPGLRGAYTDTTGTSVARVDTAIDFNWGLSSPAAGINADNFTANWYGQLRADFSEQYTFSTISDERVRLWIGNELLIDNWTNHIATEDQATKWLEAGKWYDVRVDHFDAAGTAEIRWRWSSEGQTGAGIFEIVPQDNLQSLKPSPVTFKNPLGVGADPFVLQWQGKCYMTMTTDGRSVRISRSTVLEDIHPDSLGSDTVIAWTAPTGTNYSEQVWAPELHRIGEKWYIYVAASDGNNSTHRMHVLERNAADPFGPFTYVGQLAATTNRWAIDGTVFQWQGTLYTVWSGWPGGSDGQQNLYIAEMRNPTTILGDRVMISTPQYAWEMHGLPINEGPQILIHEGQLHIIYSASGFWTPQYALGRLTYNGTGSLQNINSWTKSTQPVFQSAGSVAGVGHASFTKSPDDTQDWIVYHAHRNPPAPAGQEIRDVRIQPFTYFADGKPNFGPPLPLTQTILAPSVGPDSERPFVPGDFNADGAVDAADQALWRATFNAALFPGSAADGNGDGFVSAADYVFWRNSTSSGAAAAKVSQSPSADPSWILPATSASRATNSQSDGRLRGEHQVTTRANSHQLLLTVEIAIAEFQGDAERSPALSSTIEERRDDALGAKLHSPLTITWQDWH